MLKNSFLKNILTLLTGTVLAQAIPILISPILTRIYSPSEIGVYVIFFSTVNILAIISSGRLESAILVSKHRKDSYTTVKLAIVFSLVVCVVLYLFLIFTKEYIARFLGLSSIGDFIFLLPITALFLSVFQIYNYWLNRNDQYTSIAKGKIIQSTTTAFIHVSVSILNTLGLIIGRVLGVLISTLFLYISSRKKSPRKLPLDTIAIKKSLKTHRKFPFYSMPNALLNSISNNLPLYILERFYNADITGYYSWSVRIIQAPMGMLTSSIQQVFFKKSCELYNEGKSLHPLVVIMYKRLFLIGLFPYILLFILAPEIFSFVFGKEWRIAGEYTTYLVPWFFIAFMNSPITSILLTLEKQKMHLFYESTLFIFRGISLYAGYYFFNEAKYSIILYSLVGFIFNIVLFFILYNLSKKTTNQIKLN